MAFTSAPLPGLGSLFDQSSGERSPLPALQTLFRLSYVPHVSGSSSVRSFSGNLGRASGSSSVSGITNAAINRSGGPAQLVPLGLLDLAGSNVGAVTGSAVAAGLYGSLANATGSSGAAFASALPPPNSSGAAAQLPALGMVVPNGVYGAAQLPEVGLLDHGPTIIAVASGGSDVVSIRGYLAQIAGTSNASGVSGALPNSGSYAAPLPAISSLLDNTFSSVATAVGSCSVGSNAGDGDAFISGFIAAALGGSVCGAVSVGPGENIGQVYGSSAAYSASSINIGLVLGSSAVAGRSDVGAGQGTALGTSVVFGWSDASSGVASAVGSALADFMSTVASTTPAPSNIVSGSLGGGGGKRRYRKTIIGGKIVNVGTFGEIIPEDQADPALELPPEAPEHPVAAATVAPATETPFQGLTIPKPAGLSDEDFLTLITLLEPHL